MRSHGCAGGKDSTVLAHVLSTLNKRHDYGLQLFLLSVDEGITGYRCSSDCISSDFFSATMTISHQISVRAVHMDRDHSAFA